MKVDITKEEVVQLRSLLKEKLKKVLKYHSQREFARVQALFSLLQKISKQETD